MEKLELKHLSAYLPYRLKVSNNSFPDDINIITGLRDEKYFIDIQSKYAYGDIENCKPILRPLSDITKEIEVNGDKFVPIIELAKLYHTLGSLITHFSGVRNDGIYGIQVNCHIENDDRRFSYYQLKNEEFILSNTYEEIQKLLSWHFDIFNLIEKGLAIDINTLKS